jgi:hypothetical protein
VICLFRNVHGCPVSGSCREELYAANDRRLPGLVPRAVARELLPRGFVSRDQPDEADQSRNEQDQYNDDDDEPTDPTGRAARHLPRPRVGEARPASFFPQPGDRVLLLSGIPAHGGIIGRGVDLTEGGARDAGHFSGTYMELRTPPPSSPASLRRSNATGEPACGIGARSSRICDAYSIATIASTMIGTFSGEGPCPGTERACRPASPQSWTMRSLKPLTTAAFCPKPAAQWT